MGRSALVSAHRKFGGHTWDTHQNEDPNEERDSGERKRRQAGRTPNAGANLFALVCFVAKRLECVRLAGAFARDLTRRNWLGGQAVTALQKYHDNDFF